MDMKIDGLDKLTKQLKQAEHAFAELDGEIGTVNFDHEDPGSIETAINEIVATIDERMSGYRNNPFVEPLIEQMKENYRQGIIEKASEARLKGINE